MYLGDPRQSTPNAPQGSKRTFSLDFSPTVSPALTAELAAPAPSSSSSSSPSQNPSLSIASTRGRKRSRSNSTSTRSSAFEHLPVPALDLPSASVGMAVDAPPSTSSTNGTISSTGSGTPHKSRSILNLTSSTLFGIYSPTGYDTNRDELTTPWGTGAQTPARTPSMDSRTSPQILSTTDFGTGARLAKLRSRSFHAQGSAPVAVRGRRRGTAKALLVRAAVLFGIGVAYGMLITHLHDSRNIAPVRVNLGVRRGRGYLVFWGLMGILLGTLLPWLDTAWQGRGDEDAVEDERFDDQAGESRTHWPDMARTVRSGLGADWNPVVRSVGAFVGIAFAIRKLPWQSTLQVSLTLALVNPVIWYLIDRSKSGFFLSTAVGVTGAAVLFSINPEVVPAPATTSPRELGNKLSNGSQFGPGVSQDLIGGMISYETIGVATWISSVLFCSCVCFGNIGRRLAWTSSNSRAQRWS